MKRKDNQGYTIPIFTMGAAVIAKLGADYYQVSEGGQLLIGIVLVLGIVIGVMIAFNGR